MLFCYVQAVLAFAVHLAVLASRKAFLRRPPAWKSDRRAMCHVLAGMSGMSLPVFRLEIEAETYMAKETARALSQSLDFRALKHCGAALADSCNRQVNLKTAIWCSDRCALYKHSKVYP